MDDKNHVFIWEAELPNTGVCHAQHMSVDDCIGLWNFNFSVFIESYYIENGSSSGFRKLFNVTQFIDEPIKCFGTLNVNIGKWVEFETIRMNLTHKTPYTD